MEKKSFRRVRAWYVFDSLHTCHYCSVNHKELVKYYIKIEFRKQVYDHLIADQKLEFVYEIV